MDGDLSKKLLNIYCPKQSHFWLPKILPLRCFVYAFYTACACAPLPVNFTACHHVAAIYLHCLLAGSVTMDLAVCVLFISFILTF